MSDDQFLVLKLQIVQTQWMLWVIIKSLAKENTDEGVDEIEKCQRKIDLLERKGD